MDFKLSQQQKELQQRVRKFVEQRVLTRIAEYEEKSVLPREIFREIGAEGFWKAHISKEYGGLGLGAMAYCLVCEELAKAGAGMLAPSAMMDGMVSSIRTTLDQHGFSGLPIMSYSAKFASSF